MVTLDFIYIFGKLYPFCLIRTSFVGLASFVKITKWNNGMNVGHVVGTLPDIQIPTLSKRS